MSCRWLGLGGEGRGVGNPGLGRSGFLSVRGWDALRYGHARRRPAGAGKRGSQAGAWESEKTHIK